MTTTTNNNTINKTYNIAIHVDMFTYHDPRFFENLVNALNKHVIDTQHIYSGDLVHMGSTHQNFIQNNPALSKFVNNNQESASLSDYSSDDEKSTNFRKDLEESSSFESPAPKKMPTKVAAKKPPVPKKMPTKVAAKKAPVQKKRELDSSSSYEESPEFQEIGSSESSLESPVAKKSIAKKTPIKEDSYSSSSYEESSEFREMDSSSSLESCVPNNAVAKQSVKKEVPNKAVAKQLVKKEKTQSPDLPAPKKVIVRKPPIKKGTFPTPKIAATTTTR